MEPTSIIGPLIIIFTLLATYKGFKDFAFYETYLFDVDRILVHKEYYRIISSGFLHTNWWHFGFNIIALASFSFSVELFFGPLAFLLLYFISLIGGSGLALYIHRNHGDYRAVGASGAISGVVFASIILFPDARIGLIFTPPFMPAWVFGYLFILISIFGIKSQWGNIGHEAHLGGAIIGILAAAVYTLVSPIFRTNWLLILGMLIPVTAFLILIVRNPAVMLIDNYWGETIRGASEVFQPKPAETKREKQEELDYLLDKIRQKGIKSLTKKERKRLEELQRNL